ncbi:MAG: hypothetical protein EHM34_09825 [Nitrosopumilales archaeon]|nr:MAG: hypothetical protein EHM34_09825 [Nitrosopumilales archaeon]
MNKIQRLIVSLKVVIHLWKMGFYFSDNSHRTSGYSLGEHWGFYRLNWTNGDIEIYSVLDIDFMENKRKDVEYVSFFDMKASKKFRVEKHTTHTMIEHPHD